jgi:hypothetical protein
MPGKSVHLWIFCNSGNASILYSLIEYLMLTCTVKIPADCPLDTPGVEAPCIRLCKKAPRPVAPLPKGTFTGLPTFTGALLVVTTPGLDSGASPDDEGFFCNHNMSFEGSRYCMYIQHFSNMQLIIKYYKINHNTVISAPHTYLILFSRFPDGLIECLQESSTPPTSSKSRRHSL